MKEAKFETEKSEDLLTEFRKKKSIEARYTFDRNEKREVRKCSC